jgi:N-glycosylase/DNA lyase
MMGFIAGITATALPLAVQFGYAEPMTQLWQTLGPKRAAIQARLAEFAQLRAEADDARLFEELAYCIFTAGASARMGLNSVERVRDLLRDGTQEQLAAALTGAHRYPNSRASYLISARASLVADCQLQLRARLDSFGEDREARRDFFVQNIKGIGYKEASHYLRNIGYRGYAILDKHILRTLHDFGLIESSEPPTTKKKYLALEELMRKFAEEHTIDFDELDLLLWSNKTGEILK